MFITELKQPVLQNALLSVQHGRSPIRVLEEITPNEPSVKSAHSIDILIQVKGKRHFRWFSENL